MTLTKNFLIGFALLGILAISVGSLGWYAARQLTHSLKTPEPHFDAILLAASELSSDAQGAENQLLAFLELRDDTHARAFFKTHTAFLHKISVLEHRVPFGSGKLIVDGMRSKMEGVLRTGNQLLATPEDLAETPARRELIRQLHGQVRPLQEAAAELTAIVTRSLDRPAGVSRAVEVSSYAKNSAGHIMLFLSLDEDRHRERFFATHDFLRDRIAMLKRARTIPEATRIVEDLETQAQTVLSTGRLLLAAHERDLRHKGEFALRDQARVIKTLYDHAEILRQTAGALTQIHLNAESTRLAKAKRVAGLALWGIPSMTGLVLLLAFVLGHRLAKSFAAPLLRLKEAVIAIGGGVFDLPIDVRAKGIIGQLSGSLNEMRKSLMKTTVLRKDVANILRHLGDSLIVVGPDSGIRFVNQATLDLLGYEDDELYGKSVGVVLPEVSLMDTTIAPGEKSFRGIGTAYLAKDGTRIPVSLSQSLILNNDQEAEGSILIARDMTEQKQMDKDLNFQQFAIDHTLDAAFCVRRDGGFHFVNDAACALVGYTREELLSMRVADIAAIPPAAWAEHWQAMKHTAKTFEQRCRTRDGRVIPVEITVSPLEYDGEEYHWAFVRDITERKKGDEERARLLTKTRSHLRRLEALRELNQAITSTLELSDVLQYLLAKISRLLPFSVTVSLRNEATGNLEFAACHDRNEPEWQPDPSEAERDGLTKTVFNRRSPLIADMTTHPTAMDQPLCQRRGWVSYLGVPLIAKGQALGVLAIYTKEKTSFSREEIELFIMVADHAALAIHNSRLFASLETLNTRLEEANRAKSDFMSAMSHELRTPLHVIMGYTDLLREQLKNDENLAQVTALNAIHHQSGILSKLVVDLLTLTKLGGCQVPVDLSRAPIETTIAQVYDYIQQLNQRGLAIRCNVEKDLPSITTDHVKLKEVLQNLISNAYKFTQNGRIDLRVKNLRDQGRLEFTIRDTGTGIDESELERIFEPFYQSPKAHTGEFTGVGLGLHIVRRYLELLKGEIYVGSDPGSGSTFSFTLPYSV